MPITTVIPGCVDADASQPGDVQTPHGHDTARKRGRPRDSGKDRAIREAVWAMLAARGYDNLSLEAVAEAAGCSRTTLYNRFPGKIEMIADTFRETVHAMRQSVAVPDEPRAQLRAYTSKMADFLSGAHGRALAAIADGAAREPRLAILLDKIKQDDETLFRGIFLAIEPAATPTMASLAFDMLRGTLHTRLATDRMALEPGVVEALINAAITILREHQNASLKLPLTL